jgi:hypothetical protein
MFSRDFSSPGLPFKLFLWPMRIVLLFTIICITAYSSTGQTEVPRDPPYKRFPSVPPLKLLLTDSTTLFTKAGLEKKKPVIIMLFSPDCDHCQQKTEEIIQHIGSFKNIQLILATTLPMEKMRTFYLHYDLGRFDNIIVGKDIDYLLPVFFDIHTLPFFAFYNRKKELISVFEGAMPMDRLLNEARK